jgi:hypothetical protein
MIARETTNANLVCWPAYWQRIEAKAATRNRQPLWARVAPGWPVVAIVGALVALVAFVTFNS